jgi:hypothetical protein
MAGSFVGVSADYLGVMVDVAVVLARRVEASSGDASHCAAPSICRHLIMRFRSSSFARQKLLFHSVVSYEQFNTRANGDV